MPGGRQRSRARQGSFKATRGDCVAFFEPAVCRYRPHLLASPDVSLSDGSEAVIVGPRASSPATTKWRVLDSSDGRRVRRFTESGTLYTVQSEKLKEETVPRIYLYPQIVNISKRFVSFEHLKLSSSLLL